jgi:peptidoglycan/LPS O-acetylase OafA/YrhL
MNDRVKELDSIRGIAVIIVMLYHIFKRADYFTQNAILHFITGLTSVGWIGVDIFFTLSGFLITSILLRTREDEHYFKNFYMRRILRIVPVYVFLIVVVIAFVPGLEKGFISQMPKALIVLALFQQNWSTIFLDIPITIYLLVTWSLAIEEQFYFIWPFVVHRVRNETLLRAGVGYIALSILARIVGVAFFDQVGRVSIYDFFYFMSFTRFEELLIGALLAILLTYDELKEKIRRVSLPVFFISLSCFSTMVLVSPVPSTPTFGNVPITIAGYTTIALFTAGLIAAFSTYPETALIRRLFQNRFLAFFGEYSYSMYLFHVPVMLLILDWFWRAKMRGAEIYVLYVFITFMLTIAISQLTWNLIEKRMLRLKKYFEYK